MAHTFCCKVWLINPFAKLSRFRIEYSPIYLFFIYLARTYSPSLVIHPNVACAFTNIYTYVIRNSKAAEKRHACNAQKSER